MFGKVSPTGEGNLGLIVREPVGVVGMVLPWNFPAATLSWKISPALAAGNSIVVKPAELASLSTLRIGELALEAGIPAGVEVSDAMVHGGPYPATSDARGTSVGTLAIDRFLRSVCYQNYPPELLPVALKPENPLKLLRLVNGVYSRERG
ncbi:hypothetical protein BIY27_18720 [Gibbsiella quercinecans]|nr:hypothetical protein BIY27_18720 [Gibbsiella quercinecans]